MPAYPKRLAALALAAGLSLGGAAAPAAAAPAPLGGSFSALTYNVAGLPEGLSSSHPATNTPLISPRLAGYDVINVQEDFNYHAALYAGDNHPYRTATSGGAGIGSGLNMLSRYPITDYAQIRWSACNGTDCLTPKGFTYSRIRLAEGVYVDTYNAHPNAGVEDADLAARRANISQLAQYIVDNSAGSAVLVLGDTNTRYTRSGDNIRELVTRAGLTDPWVQLIRGGAAPAQGSPALVCEPAQITDECEVVDKILYRGSAQVRLQATRYHNEHAAFLDAAGAMLSDHDPQLVQFTWTASDTLRGSDLYGGPHGTPFTDAPALASTTPRQFLLRGGARVDQIGVTLDNGTTLTHGGTGGTARTLTLASGEHVTGIRLSTGQLDGRTRIFFAELTTDRGVVVSAGTPTAETVSLTAPAGWQIAGFSGRSGTEVDKLGALYTPIA